MSSEKQLFGKQLEYLTMLQNILLNPNMACYPRFMGRLSSHRSRYEQFTTMLEEKNFSVDQIFSELRFASLSDDLSDQADNRRETLIYQIHSRLSLPFNFYATNKFDGLIRKIVACKDDHLLSNDVSELINQWLTLEANRLEAALGDEFGSVDMNSVRSNNDSSTSLGRLDDSTDDEYALADFSAEGRKISSLLSVGLGLGVISTTLLSRAPAFLFLSASAALNAFAITTVLSALLIGYALYLGCQPVTPGPEQSMGTVPWTEADWDHHTDVDNSNFGRNLT